jgi:serine/threonine protein kinase
MAGGSLRRLLDMSRTTITEAKRRKIAKDVAMGVNYLHHHKPKIIHRYLVVAQIAYLLAREIESSPVPPHITNQGPIVEQYPARC